MTYRQEILKPFYDHLISLGFKEKKFGIAIGMLDRDGLRRLRTMTIPKIQKLQFHKQITDDLIDVIAVTVEGTATMFELSVTLAVNVEQKPNSVYGNMAGKQKNKFPDMF